ncbi:ABC transporter substrate-binding protein [Nocardioides sp. 616]|uniref:ABC transporter substrate-binding protein n=1 Tax=Nocardioides sp. 616 TaxID=2268090 RepID=UPI000CE444B6|nr:ABC transporter substrate-binding protein [Nocardioides sp. 616]
MIRRARRNLAALIAGSLLLAGTTTACGSSDAATNADGSTTIRYQTYMGSVNLPELADALGFYDNIELERLGDVQGGPESLRAVATDQVDYAAAFLGAIAKVNSTGAPLTTVVSYYGSDDTVNSSILVRTEDKLTQARDLIGKKVAVNTLGANAEAIIDTYLEEGGLTADEIDEVTLVPLPSTSTENALREGQVDAAYLGGTAREVALQRPGLDVLVADIDVVGPYSGGGITLRDDFIAKNPEVTEEFVAGIAKAIEWTKAHSKEEVIEVITDYLTEHDRAAEAESLQYWKGTGISAEGGLLADADFEIWLDWLEASGEVEPGSVDLSEIYTNEFNPYAEGSR